MALFALLVGRALRGRRPHPTSALPAAPPS